MVDEIGYIDFTKVFLLGTKIILEPNGSILNPTCFAFESQKI